MEGSSLQLLKSPKTIVLCAGHSPSQAGAASGGYNEEKQTIFMTDIIADLLRERGINVKVVPHDKGLSDAIRWVNQQPEFSFGKAWVIEIHRDSANGLTMEDASKRCGVYYGNSEQSKAVGEFMRDALKKHGANGKTWAKKHTECRFGSLGWISKTEPLAHLLELAFMQGDNSESHLRWLSEIAAAAIFEAFTGKPFEQPVLA